MGKGLINRIRSGTDAAASGRNQDQWSSAATRPAAQGPMSPASALNHLPLSAQSKSLSMVIDSNRRGQPRGPRAAAQVQSPASAHNDDLIRQARGSLRSTAAGQTRNVQDARQYNILSSHTLGSGNQTFVVSPSSYLHNPFDRHVQSRFSNSKRQKTRPRYAAAPPQGYQPAAATQGHALR